MHARAGFARGLALAAAALGMGCAAFAADAPAQGSAPAAQTEGTPPQVVYLSGARDLEKLKETNPGHYARAERIIAASNELCKPGKDEIYYARFDAEQISCSSMLLKTSNPPKRELAFTLDHVRYVTLVVLKDAEARFRRVPAVASPAPQAVPAPRAEK